MRNTLKLDATQNRNLRFLFLFVITLICLVAFQSVRMDSKLSQEQELTCEEIILKKDVSLKNG